MGGPSRHRVPGCGWLRLSSFYDWMLFVCRPAKVKRKGQWNAEFLWKVPEDFYKFRHANFGQPFFVMTLPFFSCNSQSEGMGIVTNCIWGYDDDWVQLSQKLSSRPNVWHVCGDLIFAIESCQYNAVIQRQQSSGPLAVWGLWVWSGSSRRPMTHESIHPS